MLIMRLKIKEIVEIPFSGDIEINLFTFFVLHVEEINFDKKNLWGDTFRLVGENPELFGNFKQPKRL